MLWRMMILMVMVQLAACTMPSTRIYSLFMPEEKAVTGTRTSEALVIVVSSPRYLSQPYIARRTSPFQLEIARYAKWDSPPADIVQDAFRESFSLLGVFPEVRTSPFLVPDTYSLEVTLKRFEWSDEGTDSFGELSLDSLLHSPDGKELKRISVSKKVRLDDRSYAGLAKALSSALAEGRAEVASAVAQGLPR